MSCTVTLVVRAESTVWGDTVAVAGSIAALSQWGATPPPPLTASPFPVWKASFELPPETAVEYKYVIVSSANALRWEVLAHDRNRSFTTPAPGETLVIDDGTIGDPARASATVTPPATPNTTPTRPKKPLQPPPSAPSTVTSTESSAETLQHPQHPLAEYTAQLDSSRRHVENVRAAVRRIRRIPTPDSLPTPPTTPRESSPLSEQEAAALATDTLSEAKEHVEIIRDKLRAARESNNPPPAPPSNPLMFSALATIAVAALVAAVLFFDPRIVTRLRPAVLLAANTLRRVAEKQWHQGMDYAACAGAQTASWWQTAQVTVPMRLEDIAERSLRAIQRSRFSFLLQYLDAATGAGSQMRARVRSLVDKIATSVGELRGN